MSFHIYPKTRQEIWKTGRGDLHNLTQGYTR